MVYERELNLKKRNDLILKHLIYDFDCTIGDRAIQIGDKVVGNIIKFYILTACKQQTMILCDDERK